jgi:hypothetical protein
MNLGGMVISVAQEVASRKFNRTGCATRQMEPQLALAMRVRSS